MRYLSLCNIARVNHRVASRHLAAAGSVEGRPQAPTGFVFNTNDAAGSNGQDKHADLAYSMERWTSFWRGTTD